MDDNIYIYIYIYIYISMNHYISSKFQGNLNVSGEFLLTSGILKTMKVFLFVHFCLGKYNFSLDTFLSLQAFGRKMSFFELFVLFFIMLNTNSISILFIHISNSEENKCVIHRSFFTLVNTSSVLILWKYSSHLEIKCSFHWLLICLGWYILSLGTF